MKEFIRKHVLFLDRQPQYIIVAPSQDGLRAHAVKQLSDKGFELAADTISLNKIRYDAKIIIALSHRSATTFRASIATHRSEQEGPISETEFENTVSRALWKLFNQKRRAASVKMRVPDVAVKISDADLLGVKLDGHRSLDPIGFRARALELSCQETLVAQPALDAILELLPQEQVVSVQEGPAAWPLVCIQSGAQEFMALSLLAEETVLYKYASGDFECIDTLAWGAKDIIGALARFFGVVPSEAEALIGVYMSGQASPAVLKKVESVLSGELSVLFKSVQAHGSEERTAEVFIHSQFRIPEKFLARPYLRKLGIGFVPVLLGPAWISEKFGYTLKSMEGGSSLDDVCAALAVYLLQGDTPLSKIAKRRAKWL